MTDVTNFIPDMIKEQRAIMENNPYISTQDAERFAHEITFRRLVTKEDSAAWAILEVAWLWRSGLWAVTKFGGL